MNEIFQLWNPSILAFEGVYYDFCFGLRIKSLFKPYYVKMIDNDSENVYFEGLIKKNKVFSSEMKYYINWRLEVYDESGNNLLFKDSINLYDKDITISFATKAVGDIFAWMNSIERFQEKYNCRLTVVMDEKYHEVFRRKHNYKFVSVSSVPCYAYYMLIPGGLDPSYNFIYSRLEPLHYQADNILGLKHSNNLPLLDLPEKKKTDKYVCCSFVGSSGCKNWNNKEAIQETVDYLNKIGYKVYIVGLKEDIPDRAIDDTGNKSFQERVDMISGADFFIGIGSGMSWVARACGIPVILISGFSLPFAEFETDYRIISYKGCYGCYNNKLYDDVFSQKKTIEEKKKLKGCFFQNTPKEFECSKNISSTMVIKAIKRLVETEL